MSSLLVFNRVCRLEIQSVMFVFSTGFVSYSLKNILEREDQYLYVARRTFTNLFLARTHLNLLCTVPDLTQLSLESIYL
jgi:hypothetical protein